MMLRRISIVPPWTVSFEAINIVRCKTLPLLV